MTGEHEARWPHASVFVSVDEHDRVTLSFDRSPESRKESLELPHQADRLVALHLAVIKAARALTGAASNEAAIPKLLAYAKEQDRQRLQPPSRVTSSSTGSWRSVPQDDVSRRYPVGSDYSKREIPCGIPDSNRKRH